MQAVRQSSKCIPEVCKPVTVLQTSFSSAQWAISNQFGNQFSIISVHEKFVPVQCVWKMLKIKLSKRQIVRISAPLRVTASILSFLERAQKVPAREGLEVVQVESSSKIFQICSDPMCFGYTS